MCTGQTCAATRRCRDRPGLSGSPGDGASGQRGRQRWAVSSAQAPQSAHAAVTPAGVGRPPCFCDRNGPPWAQRRNRCGHVSPHKLAHERDRRAAEGAGRENHKNWLEHPPQEGHTGSPGCQLQVLIAAVREVTRGGELPGTPSERSMPGLLSQEKCRRGAGEGPASARRRGLRRGRPFRPERPRAASWCGNAGWITPPPDSNLNRNARCPQGLWK